MKDLIEKLGKKFDEYHNEQLRIDDPQNPDYYLFMGKASAIGDLLTELEIENNISKEKVHDDFKEWADSFFKVKTEAGECKYLNNYFSQQMAYNDFRCVSKRPSFNCPSSKFIKQMIAYCELNGYTFNPIELQTHGGRIIRKIDDRTQLAFYVQTKATHP